jgi:cell division protein FtsB
MDWQTIINILAGALLGVGGWFARQLWDSVKELKNDISGIRLHMSENYVKKSEVENFRADMDKRFDRIELLLDKLFEKLDGKVDK